MQYYVIQISKKIETHNSLMIDPIKINEMWYNVVKLYFNLDLNNIDKKIDELFLDVDLIEKNTIQNKLLIKRFPKYFNKIQIQTNSSNLTSIEAKRQYRLFVIVQSLLSNRRKEIPIKYIEDFLFRIKNLVDESSAKEKTANNHFQNICDYFKNKNEFPYKKIYEFKIEIVELLLNKRVASQVEIRKNNKIKIKDRSNFKKTHMLPLIKSGIIEELKLTLNSRPHYRLTRKFIEEIQDYGNNISDKVISKELSELVDIKKESIVRSSVKNYSNELIKF